MVVNDQLTGAARPLPDESFAAVTLTVYRVPAASCAAGLKVAVRVSEA
jgi:hypothetical protein